MLKHDRRRDCARFGENVRERHAEQRGGETVHRCQDCGAVLSELD